jgi:uncharacterized membrane protein YdfJ with MMPL/SSD domain
MKRRVKRNRTDSSKKVSRNSLIGVVAAITILLIGGITALSMQAGKTQRAKLEERKAQVANHPRKNYVTINAAGQTVAVDGQTGQARPLTPEEAQRLAQGIEELVNQSTEGLVQVHHADGSVSIDLQGRFQNVAVAKINADGTISQSCVDNTDSAAAFFEIDPRLFKDAAKPAPTSKSQPGSSKLEDR